MSVKAVDSSVNTRKNGLGQNSKNNNHQQSFTGFNPIVPVMDAISRGGFAASFIAQDGIGMVAPRIKEGMNRGRQVEQDPETGKERKVGPYNWAFARREGVREILSGPSAFIIPAAILGVIKKYSGKANNVPVNLINTYSESFTKSAKEHGHEAILTAGKDNITAREAFFKQVFKDTLESSIEGKLSPDELDNTAAKMAKELLEIEKAKSKGFFKHLAGKVVEGSKEDRLQALINEYMDLRKKHVNPSSNQAAASFNVHWRKDPVGSSIGKVISSMQDYADDAIASAQKYLKNETNGGDLQKFIKDFSHRRSGSRVLTNFGMFLAVVGFYDLIPKIYNLGLKENPDEVKVDNNDNKNKTESSANAADAGKSKEVSFQGGTASVNRSVGKKVLKTGWLKRISDEFEFNGPAMSVTAMSTLLFAFCLPPRIRNAKDEHDRNEIIVRDIASFSAILFAANALSRAFSDMFAKISGLALNTKPADHNKSFIHKLKNYFTPGNGVSVMKSDELISKHSNLRQYNGEILGYIDFLKNNGGDPRKVFAMDENVKQAAEEILGSKSLKDATIEEIETAFKAAKEAGSKALDTIYDAFKAPNNKFVSRAKTMNSAFEFASIILLVPAFMIWLARYCERMTKEAKAKQKAALEAQNQQQTAAVPPQAPTLTPSQIPPAVKASKLTMEGFARNN